MPAEDVRKSEAEWDAEIEADFQRVKAATLAAGKRKRSGYHIGCPLAFLADVCRLTDGRTAAMVALLVCRRVHVCHSWTVTLPIEEPKELGIDRQQKAKALAKLQAAGLIQIEHAPAGRSAKVTLLWKRR